MKYFKSIYTCFLNYINKGVTRSVKAKKNILASFVFKGINIACGLLIVPMALHYLDETRYGIWLTISSVVGWFSFFDVGLGQGLRNKFAEAKAKNQKKLAANYISTTYIVLIFLVVGFYILFLLTNQFVEWAKIFNTTKVPESELQLLALIVFGFFALKLVAQLIGNILVADQKPALKDFIEMLGKIGILAGIYILMRTSDGSLLSFGLIYSLVPVFVLIFASIYFFNTTYKEYSPNLKKIDFSVLSGLTDLGVKFFILTITFAIVYTTDNIIIVQIFSPDKVTPYQIAGKYFSVVLIGFSIILSPFWSAFTEAYAKNDLNWIEASIDKLIKIWFGVLGLIFFMTLISPFVYSIWVGDSVNIPIALSLGWAIFVALQTGKNIFIYFLNGIGKIKVQLRATVFAAIVNIPLSIFLAKNLKFGVVGVITATIVTEVMVAVVLAIQYRKIINGKDKGIWAQ